VPVLVDPRKGPAVRIGHFPETFPSFGEAVADLQRKFMLG
jgi:hypothetical protein